MNLQPFRDKYRVTELDHAYRINGVVDIYKNGTTIYDIVNNKYHRIADWKDRDKFCFELLETYPEREDFKKTGKGKMTYQEFKNIKKREEYDYNAVRAEDYQWKINLSNTSEDHLYLLVHGEDVKIGRSIDPQERLKTLKTALSNNAKMYVFENKGFMETILHRAFADIRKHGEWFSMCVRVKHFITKYHNPVNIISRAK